MLTSIQSAGVAPEVNLRITQVRKQAKEIHPGLETKGRCHQKSKTGYQWPHEKDLCPPNFFKKKNNVSDDGNILFLFDISHCSEDKTMIIVVEEINQVLTLNPQIRK